MKGMTHSKSELELMKLGRHIYLLNKHVYVPDTVLRASQILPHSIFITAP